MMGSRIAHIQNHSDVVDGFCMFVRLMTCIYSTRIQVADDYCNSQGIPLSTNRGDDINDSLSAPGIGTLKVQWTFEYRWCFPGVLLGFQVAS